MNLQLGIEGHKLKRRGTFLARRNIRFTILHNTCDILLIALPRSKKYLQFIS